MPAVDKFATFPLTLDVPASDAIAVTTSDTLDLLNVPRALYVGGAGDLKVITVQGTTVTFSSVPAGFILPVRVTRIFATLTTATNIVGLY